MRKILPLLCLLVLLAAPACADIPADLLKKAEGGDAQAQLDVATMYMGDDADETKALDWLRKAADGNNKEALYSLAMLYHNGKMVTQDDAEAAKWFEKAAGQGDAVSQNELANFYHDGTGVAQDDTQAVKWWQQAADRAQPRAQMALGQAYLEGKGVAQDNAEAYFWLTFGAEGDFFPGDAEALRKQAAEKLTPEQIAEQHKRAADWASLEVRDIAAKAAKGDKAAQTQLGLHYQFGSGVLRDEGKMKDWYLKAANAGYAEAQYSLGQFYYSGPGKWNADEAYKWYAKAAKKGHALSQKQLGDFTRDGVGLKKDPSEAAKWYRKAAIQGEPFACAELGALYYSGTGVAQDNAEAVFWLSLAAALDHDIYKDQREAASDALTADEKEGVKKRLLSWQAKQKP